MILGVLSGLLGKRAFARKVFGDRLNENGGRDVLLLLLVVFTPILLPYLVSKFTTPIYLTRSAIAGHFAFFLLVARGITSLRWTGLRALALALVLALSVRPLLREGYVHHSATDFRRVVDYLVSNVGSTDKIILCSHPHLTWPFQYYAKARGLGSEIVKFGSSEKVSDILKKQKGWYVSLADRKDQCEPALHALAGIYQRLEIEEISATNIEIAAFIDGR
jgi:hypothetical protein